MGGSSILPGLPQPPPPDEVAHAQAVISDAQQVKQQLDMLDKIGKTLELLYNYEVDEQQQSFKSMMKMTVRRSATAGVGWVRLGFQRMMGKSPDLDSRIADMQQQLSTVERISADLADGEIEPDSPEVEQLRLTIAELAKQTDIVVREGLLFSYPKSTAVIPDPRTTQLRDFLGANWVAEEFILSPNEVQEIYGVDVKSKFTSYKRTDIGTDYERAYQQWEQQGQPEDSISKGDASSCMVWELFNKKDGLVYVLCDGYCDFLKEPTAPDVYTDRFWPWFAVLINEADGQVYPPSNVQLMRHMQLEYNRSRQGLREHRFANRPKTGYAEGALSEQDVEAFKAHPVNAMIAIQGLQPGQDVNQLVAAIKGAPVDMNIYEVNPVFQDVLRVVGDQEADFGGQAGGTATEANIASSAKQTATGSSVDDIDETLSAMARAASQILLLNVSEEIVKQAVGPGAVWPSLTKAEVARDLYLDVKAGSSGKPNQQQELQNFERLAPFLMQIPGITPTFMAHEAIRRLDDNIDIDQAVSEGMPSILSMNGVKPGASTGPGQDPNAQGPQGAAQNSPGPPAPDSQAPGPPSMDASPPPPGAMPS